jgi:hypothetical protein
MRQRYNLRIQAMDHRMQGNRVIHVGIHGRIVLQDFTIEVKRADVHWTKRAEGRPKPVHQHSIFANGYAEMSRDSCAQAGTIECSRRTTNIKLNGFN